jgi:hypothetical protein
VSTAEIGHSMFFERNEVRQTAEDTTDMEKSYQTRLGRSDIVCPSEEMEPCKPAKIRQTCGKLPQVRLKKIGHSMFFAEKKTKVDKSVKIQ